MSNLRLINETTISSSQSSTTVNDIFSSDYDIYKIVVNDFTQAGATETAISMRYVNSAGSILTDSNYDYAFLTMKTGASFAEGRNTNQAKLLWAAGYSGASPDTMGNVIYVFNPYSSSSYTFSLGQNFSSDFGTTYGVSWKSIGVYTQTSSVTGINLYDSDGAGAYDGGVIRTYGLRVDS